MIGFALSALLLAQVEDVPPEPVRTFTLAVVPVSFKDQRGGKMDLSALFTGRLHDWFQRVSGDRFDLRSEIRGEVRLTVRRGSFRDRHLEPVAKGLDLEDIDGVVFVAAGGLGRRGTPLWPHQETFRFGKRRIDYVFLVEEAGDRALGIAAHEISHFLGLEDKYDNPNASVGDLCLMGTGYDSKDPSPPCGACRETLGWATPRVIDSRKVTKVVLDADPTGTVRVQVARGGSEALLFEMRDQLIAWHVQGGGRITLIGVYPGKNRTRITPYSDPPFRARSIGSWPVWVTDIRIVDGKAEFLVGPGAKPTPAEARRRASVGRPIGN